MKNITIVGAGLFGSVCARELTDKGYKCFVVDKRNHIAGNCYTKKIHNINVHCYGAHIFHTKNENIWNYINRFSKFNNYVHKVYVNHNNKIYSFPFNIMTYQQVLNNYNIPLRKKEINILINKFIKGYSEKQWNRKFENIPVEIINRVPFKYNLNNDYFEGQYQGIPINGYTDLFKNLLKNINIKLNKKITLADINKKDIIIFTGCIDKLFNYKFGKLSYRSLVFEHKYLPKCDNFQGNSVINYVDKKISYIRIIEHKHFEFNKCKGTIITKEFPSNIGEPYYIINDKENVSLYKKYIEYAKKEYPNIYFGGRLGLYKYLDMDETIENALNLVKKLSYE